jgi:hypothetical protein
MFCIKTHNLRKKLTLFKMKNQILLLNIAILLIAFSCNTGKKGSDSETSADTLQVKEITLTKKWETDTLLTTVESVIYNQNKNILYATCMSGDADLKDGIGFIAQVDLDGNIVNADWITGLNAPKGMAIYGNSLFVTDIDAIVEIDIEKGEVISTYQVEDVTFLNDADVDANGNVYVSAMQTSKIIKLSNGVLSVFMDSVAVPNGVFAEGDNLLVAYWDEQKMKSINTSTLEVTEMAGGLENPDGIEAVGDGGYLVSAWNGKISYVSADGEVTLLLDTTAEEVSAADIEYVPSLNLLLVPTFGGNSVVAYELKN